jgi:1,4-dihydroxy-2-naphthoate octaprenyltransferase
MNRSALPYKPFTPKAALELASPPSLVAAIMPVLVGGVAAVGLSLPVPLTLDLRAQLVWVLMLVTAVLMQAAVNTLNDYQDFLTGTDTAETILDEHDASIVYNGIDPAGALRFGIALLACAAVSGAVVVVLSGWPLLVVGLIAAAVLVLYSFGPKPISYLPLGELISGIVMGGLITGATYYALTLAFTPLVFAVIVPPVVTIALIMQTNNTCDIERDINAGRRTLPVLLGRARSIKLARILSWATPAWMVLALSLAAVFVWRSLLLLFVNAIIAGCLYFLLRHRLERIAKGPYDLVNRGPMMGNITAFCRLTNLAWAGAILAYWLLMQLMLGGVIRAA